MENENHQPKYKKKFYKKIKKIFENASNENLRPGRRLGNMIIRFLDGQINDIEFRKQRKKLLSPQLSTLQAMKEIDGFVKQPEIWNPESKINTFADEHIIYDMNNKPNKAFLNYPLSSDSDYSNNEAFVQKMTIEEMNNKDYVFVCTCTNNIGSTFIYVSGELVLQFKYAKRFKAKDICIISNIQKIFLKHYTPNIGFKGEVAIHNFIKNYDINTEYNVTKELVKMSYAVGIKPESDNIDNIDNNIGKMGLGTIDMHKIWNDGIVNYSYNEAVAQNLSLEELNNKDYVFICGSSSFKYFFMHAIGELVLKFSYAKRIKAKDVVIYDTMQTMSIVNYKITNINNATEIMKKWLDDYDINADYNAEEEIIKQMELLGLSEEWKKISELGEIKDKWDGTKVWDG